MIQLPLGLPDLDGVPLIVELFPLPHRQLGLGTPSFKVYAQGHQRQTLLLDLADQPVDLAPVEETLSFSERIVIFPIAVSIGTDVAANEPDLASLHPRVGLPEIGLAVSEGFHLRSEEGEPDLVDLQDLVVVKGLLIGGDDRFAFGHTLTLPTPT